MGALPAAQSHTPPLFLLASFPIFPVLSSSFSHLCYLFPLLAFASALLSSRSSESETSVRRKVSLVLEQMQPLLVSDHLLVGPGGRVRACGAWIWMWTHSFLPCFWQMTSPVSAKALAGQSELTRKVEELQQKLDDEVKVRGD